MTEETLSPAAWAALQAQTASESTAASAEATEATTVASDISTAAADAAKLASDAQTLASNAQALAASVANTTLPTGQTPPTDAKSLAALLRQTADVLDPPAATTTPVSTPVSSATENPTGTTSASV